MKSCKVLALGQLQSDLMLRAQPRIHRMPERQSYALDSWCLAVLHASTWVATLKRPLRLSVALLASLETPGGHPGYAVSHTIAKFFPSFTTLPRRLRFCDGGSMVLEMQQCARPHAEGEHFLPLCAPVDTEQNKSRGGQDCESGLFPASNSSMACLACFITVYVHLSQGGSVQ
jgi:hypothetical protein